MQAESFFFDRVTALRRDIHVVVTTRDVAVARQIKVVTRNRFPVFFILLCVKSQRWSCFILQRRVEQQQPESLAPQMKVKSIEAFAVLNMNGFDKVANFPPPPPCSLQRPHQILRKHDVLMGTNTRDDFLKNVAWRSIMSAQSLPSRHFFHIVACVHAVPVAHRLRMSPLCLFYN